MIGYGLYQLGNIMLRGHEGNVADTGVVNKIVELMGKNKNFTPCQALREFYNGASGAERQKIKKTQKQFGCRPTGGD
jgi:hypothetical protein